MTLKVPSLTPISDILTKLTTIPEDQSALELSAMLKRAEVLLEKIRESIKSDANSEFITKATSDKKELRFCDNYVVVTRYTPRSFWDYPLEVIKQENVLKDMQKQAQLSGKAVKKKPLVDVKNDTIFSMSIVENPVSA